MNFFQKNNRKIVLILINILIVSSLYFLYECQKKEHLYHSSSNSNCLITHFSIDGIPAQISKKADQQYLIIWQIPKEQQKNFEENWEYLTPEIQYSQKNCILTPEFRLPESLYTKENNQYVLSENRQPKTETYYTFSMNAEDFISEIILKSVKIEAKDYWPIPTETPKTRWLEVDMDLEKQNFITLYMEEELWLDINNLTFEPFSSGLKVQVNQQWLKEEPIKILDRQNEVKPEILNFTYFYKDQKLGNLSLNIQRWSNQAKILRYEYGKIVVTEDGKIQNLGAKISHPTDDELGKIEINFVSSSDYLPIVPRISYSEKAQISPALTTVFQPNQSPWIHTVTAEDGRTQQQYQVIIKRIPCELYQAEDIEKLRFAPLETYCTIKNDIYFNTSFEPIVNFSGSLDGQKYHLYGLQNVLFKTVSAKRMSNFSNIGIKNAQCSSCKGLFIETIEDGEFFIENIDIENPTISIDEQAENFGLLISEIKKGYVTIVNNKIENGVINGGKKLKNGAFFIGYNQGDLHFEAGFVKGTKAKLMTDQTGKTNFGGLIGGVKKQKVFSVTNSYTKDCIFEVQNAKSYQLLGMDEANLPESIVLYHQQTNKNSTYPSIFTTCKSTANTYGVGWMMQPNVLEYVPSSYVCQNCRPDCPNNSSSGCIHKLTVEEEKDPNFFINTMNLNPTTWEFYRDGRWPSLQKNKENH